MIWASAFVGLCGWELEDFELDARVVDGDDDAEGIGAFAPTYLCSASGRVNETTMRKSRMPLKNIPTARGNRDTAWYMNCMGWCRGLLASPPFPFVSGAARARALCAENLAVDDEASKGADCKAPGSSSYSASFASESGIFEKPCSKRLVRDPL